MAYPEKNASYDHKPKFIERMKRAEGGGVEPQPSDLYDQGQLSRIADQERLSNIPAEKMPMIKGVDTGDDMDADTSANVPKSMRGLTPKRDGGRVRKRATGGVAQGENLQSTEAPLKLLRPQPQALNDQAFGRAYRTFGDAYSPSAKQSEEGD